MGKGKKKTEKESYILNCQKMHSYLLRKSDGFEQALKKHSTAKPTSNGYGWP